MVKRIDDGDEKDWLNNTLGITTHEGVLGLALYLTHFSTFT